MAHIFAQSSPTGGAPPYPPLAVDWRFQDWRLRMWSIAEEEPEYKKWLARWYLRLGYEYRETLFLRFEPDEVNEMCRPSRVELATWPAEANAPL